MIVEVLAKMLHLLAFAALVGTACASYGANINYRSPSFHHPGMGISIRKVTKRQTPGASYSPSQLSFTHGVASGDPWPNSVIIWTRVAPTADDVQDNSTTSEFVPLYNPVPIYNDTDENKPPSNAPICVSYKVATDRGLAAVVDSGTAYTSSDVDYTVKVKTAA